MRVVPASYEIMSPDIDDPNVVKKMYRLLEDIGRVSHDSVSGEDTAESFIKRIIMRGHETILEHASMTVKFTVDRGVSHEIVRHRIASFNQESTRYCNYSKDKYDNNITFIYPYYLNGRDDEGLKDWTDSMKVAEDRYFAMLNNGYKPEEARAVLPISLKTTLVMTANMREWRHFFMLRAEGTTGKPHPQMLEVVVPLLNECKAKMPALFFDIEAYKED